VEEPHGVTFAAFAEISASIAEGDRPRDAILSARGLSAAAWDEVSAHYNGLIAADAVDADGALAEAFAAEFARAQDALKPVPAMTPEEWAQVASAVAGPDGAAALDARGLSSADYLRLSRRWARDLAHDPALARRYFAAMYAIEKRQRAAS
jgi:hypothetical protein